MGAAPSAELQPLYELANRSDLIWLTQHRMADGKWILTGGDWVDKPDNVAGKQ